jgi:hypothetical protein
LSLTESKDLTLVVGDVHLVPGENLRRAVWLGKAINELAPNRVVFIGDFLTLDSLSAWDKNKRKLMEGRRYEKDIQVGRDFLDKMYAQMNDTIIHDTQFILTEGNHETRLWRYLDEHPTFADTVDYRVDLGITDWLIVPYGEYTSHKGVHFTHIPFNESRPIGGKYAVYRALECHQYGTVFGHTHKLAVASLHRHGATHLNQSLNVGCYFERDPDYAHGTVTSYWRGIVLIDHYKHGRFGWTPISMGRMRQEYETKGRKKASTRK